MAPPIIEGIAFLVGLSLALIGTVVLFGDDATGGPIQTVLLLTAVAAGFAAKRRGLNWEAAEEALKDGAGQVIMPILILMSVGAFIGAGMASGSVPTLIYFGLKIVDPSWFFPVAAVLSALTSMAIGSSWTTAGTVGVALMGIALGLDLSLPITAGAVISGAYFGDKLSPLSDTTNLAAAMCRADLYSHIRSMARTTIPAFVIAIILFSVLGSQAADANIEGVERMIATLEEYVNPHIALLLPILLIVGLAVWKVPAPLAILAGTALALVLGLFFNPALMSSLGGGEGISDQLRGAFLSVYAGFTISTGNERVDELLSRGGTLSMLSTVFLILAAVTMGSIVEKARILQPMIQATIERISRRRHLVTATIGTGLVSNCVTAEQYIGVIMTSRLMKDEYAARGIEPQILSRAVEDSATMTSPLIPWNNCGAYMAATLGVPTLAYLPFAFLNLLSPLFGIAYAWAADIREQRALRHSKEV